MIGQYQVMSDIEHRLNRPEVYIGPNVLTIGPMLIFRDGLRCESIEYNLAAMKIIDEILVNATDHKVRMETTHQGAKVTQIHVNFLDTNVLEIKNDGMGIDHGTVKVAGKDVRLPEAIFTVFRSGTNFDDSTARLYGGKNGEGAKSCVVNCSNFLIESQTAGELYRQTIQKNMTCINPPVIQSSPGSCPDYTRIVLEPDQAHLGTTIQNMKPWIIRRVLDITLYFREIQVFIDNQQVSGNYIDKCMNYLGASSWIEHSIPHNAGIDRWRIFLSAGNGTIISYINGVETIGGSHVNLVLKEVYTGLKPMIPEGIDQATMKRIISGIIVCFTENPTFKSQTKEQVVMRTFPIQPSIPEEQIKKLYHLLKNALKGLLEAEDQKLLKKSDAKKGERLGKIEDYRAANILGPESTLWLAEGLSAIGSVQMALRALGRTGSDYHGVYPLRGKIMNPLKHGTRAIAENEIFSNLKKIIGLINGKPMTLRDLNYSHANIVADADDDGIHIRSLFINMINSYWPELLRLGFIRTLRTPCVKILLKNEKLSFYTLAEFTEYSVGKNIRKDQVRYYKGLATNTNEEFREYILDMSKHLLAFDYTDQSNIAIRKAFSRNVEIRKDWIRKYNPVRVPIFEKLRMNYEEYIDHFQIMYVHRSILRAIPNICDSLTIARRKVMYTMLTKKYTGEIKTISLASLVAEETHYHHGQASLADTISKMAQDFAGSNNCNLLLPKAYFGSRDEGVNSYGSPRYTFTCLSPVAKALFPRIDLEIYQYLSDEGEQVEPVWMLPIIPLILVNGASGIGTGFSTMIPGHRFEDVVNYTIAKIKGLQLPEIRPYFRGFRGRIEVTSGAYIAHGTMVQIGNQTIVTEIPPDMTFKQFRKILEELITAGKIQSYREYMNEAAFEFHIQTQQPQTQTQTQIAHDLSLSSSYSLKNMNLWNANNELTKYETIQSIADEFLAIREQGYVARKKWLLTDLDKKIRHITVKYEYIQGVIDGKIILFLDHKARKVELVIADIDTHTSFKELNEPYSFLLDLPTSRLTEEGLEDLKKQLDNLRADHERITKSTIQEMWIADLQGLIQVS